MTSDRRERTQFLKQKSLQRRFLQSLQERGGPGIEGKFAFVEEAEYDRAWQEIQDRRIHHRDHPLERLADQAAAIRAVEDWLRRNAGRVLRFVGNPGTLAGDAADFLAQMPHFNPQEVIFVRDDLCSAISVWEADHDGEYLLAGW